MTKLLKSFIGTAFLLMSFQGLACEYSFKNLNLCFDLRWGQEPKVNDDSPFTLEFKKKNGGPLTEKPAAFSARIWMPFMDHGSAPLEWEFVEPGKAQISNVWFIMDGYWELQVKSAREVVKVPIEL